MTSQVLNFMWLNLDLPAPPDPADGSIREPLPKKYIKNIRKGGAAHPAAEIVLWVDSKRLTERQMEYLKKSVEAERQNVHLQDLRTIPAYDQEPLYNKAETNPEWRDDCGQTALIWRQVDAAKVLVSLQGDYDQTFFADLDHAHLDIASPEVQGMLEKHGLLIGSNSGYRAYVQVENQLWGLNRSRRGFFEQYCATALEAAHNGQNAWEDLVNKVDRELVDKEEIPLKEICLPIGDDGSEAEQPGSELRYGGGEKTKPSLIPAGKLAKLFNKSSNDNNQDDGLSAAPRKAIQNQPKMGSS